MTTVSYVIPNISCGHCVKTIQNEVSELQGVSKVQVDQLTKIANISFDSPASEEKIKALLAEINYPASN